MTETVGIIGLGIMGSAMATHLVTAGYRVVGHDILPDAMTRFTDLGGTPCGDVAAVAAQASVLLTSLPSVAALEVVVAALEAEPRGGLVLAETSTFPLADKQAAAARLTALGITMLDCPLSGSGAQAKTRDVLVYASGPAEAYARCLPVFEAFSRAPHLLGEFGNGTRMKLVANLLVAIHTAAAGEAFAMARMAGLDPAQMFEVIADGAGGSSSLKVRGPMLIAQEYLPIRTMPLALWRKDMRVIAEFADSLQCPTPMFSAAVPLFNAAVASGYGDQDTAAVAAVFRQMVEGSMDG
jgi:3-hydroxyisobutyrate dehydrogenase-like beta-hydroxyacid dehydrogenase